jgi:hypothetical protein
VLIPVSGTSLMVEADLTTASVTYVKQANPRIMEYRPDLGEPYDEITVRLPAGSVNYPVERG